MRSRDSEENSSSKNLTRHPVWCAGRSLASGKGRGRESLVEDLGGDARAECRREKGLGCAQERGGLRMCSGRVRGEERVGEEHVGERTDDEARRCVGRRFEVAP